MNGLFTLLTMLPIFLFPTDPPSDILHEESTATIEWLTWKEGMKRSKKSPGLVLVDIYSDQCRMCKLMDQRTLLDSNVISYINEHFYPIKLDAKGQEVLTWKGEAYEWNPKLRAGIHMLAYELCSGNPSFPAFVVLDESGTPIHMTKGFKNQGAFLSQLKMSVKKAETQATHPGR